VILSGNAIDHAVLSLAAMYVGIPVVPVSGAWTLLSPDGSRVASVIEQVDPGLVYAGDAELYAAGLQHADPETVVTSVDALMADDADVDGRAALVGPETIAKILFTSGSTGAPKGVLNPHRMLTSNQAMIRHVWPFVEDQPPVLVDWLPWNHTFGGNHNFNLVLSRGGTLHIDMGRPAPSQLGPTLQALREISPTIYFNVPAGFAALLPHLEGDVDLAERFFKKLKVVFYAGASLPPDLWTRLEALSVRTTGERVAMSSGWGSTETAPAATTVHADIDRAGVIGWPAPGSEIRMVPLPGEDRFELRVRGPHVTPGYHGRPDLTEAAFDDAGFYVIGDAGRLATPGDPLSGLVFDGRVAEDFKLLSGTWVRAGRLRVAALAAFDGLIADALVTGHDQAEVGLLAWPNTAAVAARGLSPRQLRGELATKLKAWGAGRASSERVTRIVLLETPPDPAAGEITDKGYINQRLGLQLRAEALEGLYAEEPAADVIVLGRPPADRIAGLKAALIKHGSLAAFFGGFLYDTITLRRIDKVFDNVLLAAYLLLLGVLLVFERRLEWHRSVPKFVSEYPRAIELGTQFLFGGLFSAYIVFYFKSAGGLGSLGFMLLLAGGMVINEFRDGALRRLETIRIGLYFFTAFSFFLFAIPVFTGSMHMLMWVPAAGGAALMCLAVVLATHAGGRGKLPSFLGGTTLRERLLLHGTMMASLTLGLALFSGLGLIPPVPLSVSERVVAHSVERQEDGYHLMVDRGGWTRKLTLRPPRVRWAEGESVVVFTAIFAPKTTELKLAHRWQREAAGEWIDTEPKPIPVTVVGGRSGGYRTYTRKRHVSPGDWRVVVETDDGRAVGTVRFDVEAVSPERIRLKEVVR
jgi:feruloyl-CoA synthase